MSQPQQQYKPPSADEFLGGDRVRSAQFGKVRKGASPVPGTVEHGTIVGQLVPGAQDFDGPRLEAAKSVQRKKYNPGKTDDGALLFWDDGKPQWQLVVHIQTDQRVEEDDDGIRAIFVFGQLKKAVTDALKQAGVKKLEIGGHLYVKFTEQIVNDAGFRQNLFACKYEPPVAANPQDDFFGTPAQQADVATVTPSAYDTAPSVYDTATGGGATSETMFDKLKRQGEAGVANLNRSRATKNGFEDEPPF